MLFLINNPTILFVGLVMLGFMGFIGTKIAKEINLNSLLRVKQGAMRIKVPFKGIGTRIGLLSSAALAPVVVVAVALTIGTSATITPTGEIYDIHNSADIMDIYDSFQENMSSYNTFGGFWRNDLAMDGALEAGGILDDTSGYNIAPSDQGSDDYSEVNVQVIGVDEMDNVIMDGKYIYSIYGSMVKITLAYTQGLESDALVKYMDIEYITEDEVCPTGFSISGLYIDDDYLVVIGSEYEYYCDAKDPDSGDSNGEDPDGDIDSEIIYPGYARESNSVKIYVYDKTDEFTEIAQYEVSGNLIGTRKIDDNLYIITNSYIPFYLDDVDLNDYLPYYIASDTKITSNYNDIVYVEGTSPNSFTAFYALDLDHELVDMEVVLGDSGYNLYVSNENIYLVGNMYYFAPMTEWLDVQEPVSETKTAILKVAITGADLEFHSMGAVDGYALNQFSMDEYDGNLRIVTTTVETSFQTDDFISFWSGEVRNNIYVLNEDMEVISVTDDFGKPRETVKSSRFVGEFCYVVTFEQTDPFYIIDLSDPFNPVKRGELEVPGFSSYLQPLGNDFILGIGFGDNSGGTNGLKISVYDVRDKDNPVLFDELIFDYEEFGWGYSTATYNHKDLLVSLSKGLIALPFSTYSYSNSEYSYDSGILVLKFDPIDGLSRDGYIQHEVDTTENVYVYKIKFIENFLYTVSNKYIKISTIEDPEVIINELDLTE